MSSLQGQVALVTGGGRGIGRAIAQKLATAGARVAVLARSSGEIAETARLINQSGGCAEAFTADVTVPSDVLNAAGKIEQSLGPVDLLINNAGEIKPFGPLWETNTDEWWRNLEVNLRGPLLCIRAVMPGMVARRRGRIINIASGAATQSTPYFSSYIAAKTALVRFTECLALEAKPYGVSLFALTPGTVRTAMSSYSLDSTEGRKWLPWFRKIFDQHMDVPVDRPASLALELASGKADALSGRLISIFDDLESLIAHAPEIEQRNLYALKLDKLKPPEPGSAMASVLAEAHRFVASPDNATTAP